MDNVSRNSICNLYSWVGVYEVWTWTVKANFFVYKEHVTWTVWGENFQPYILQVEERLQ